MTEFVDPTTMIAEVQAGLIRKSTHTRTALTNTKANNELLTTHAEKSGSGTVDDTNPHGLDHGDLDSIGFYTHAQLDSFSHDHIYGETPSGSCDGSNKSFEALFEYEDDTLSVYARESGSNSFGRLIEVESGSGTNDWDFEERTNRTFETYKAYQSGSDIQIDYIKLQVV